MKSKMMLAAVAFMVCSAGSAFAAGPYVSAAGGVSILHDNDVKVSGVGTVTANYDTGYGMSIAAGYDFQPVRVEFDFGYKSTKLNKLTGPGGSAKIDLDTNVMSYMVNGFFDFKNSTIVTPFVGAGVGLLNGEFKQNGYSVDANAFGYQFIVGTAFNLNKNFAIDLSYRFQGAGGDFSKDGVDVAYTSSNIFAGVRYTFN